MVYMGLARSICKKNRSGTPKKILQEKNIRNSRPAGKPKER
jgi:hypothetical protein